MTVLTGTAYWTHIVETNTKGAYPSNKYEIVLGNLDAAGITSVKELGMSKKLMNKGDELGTYIKLKNTNQPEVIDKDKNPIHPIPLVGNGSKVRVQVNTYEMPKFGLQMGWQTLMILDLVEFKNKRLDEFDDELPKHMQG